MRAALRKASYGQFCVKIHKFSLPWQQDRSGQSCLTPLNWLTLKSPRVLNRPEFSGRHDFQAEKFGRQCAKSGSHAVGLEENSGKKLT